MFICGIMEFYVPAEYFRLTYDLDSRVDRHLFSLGFF